MNLHSFFVRALSSVLVISMLTLPCAQTARASLMTTESFINEQSQSTPRGRILMLLEKDQVVKKLKEFGVSPNEAKERIASLSDAEVAEMNSKLDHLPAGADAAEAILGTALVVFLVLLITDILCLTKVFRFTRCAS